MDEVKKLYNFMIEYVPQFKEFVEAHKDLSTDELMQKYNIESRS